MHYHTVKLSLYACVPHEGEVCNAVSCYTVIALTPVNSQLSHTVLLRIILSN